MHAFYATPGERGKEARVTVILVLERNASRRCGARREKERNSATAKEQIHIAVITGHYGDGVAPVTP
jgi:hypothetical protein